MTARDPHPTRTLEAAERRLRALIENEPECVKLLDREGRLIEMNAAGLRMIEADSPEQVLGQCIYGVVAPEHRERFRALTESVCRGGRGVLEFELVGYRGTRRWMQTHAVPFRDESRNETILLAITRDISEQKRATQALYEAERRFRLFMDNVPVRAWIKDSARRTAWVNRRYQTDHGVRSEEVIGRDDFELYPPEQARLFRAQDDAVLRARCPVQYTTTLPNPDGSESTYLVVRFPLPDAAGLPGVGGIALDVSESHGLARTVRELLKRLVTTQEAERRKVAADLHDLIGQKLTALGINLDIVRQSLPETERATLSPRLAQMSVLLEETIGAIREVMSELRPPALDEHGLTAALFQYGSTFEARTGLRVQVSGPAQRRPLPQETAISLFRIAQEALTNAAKHSGASRVQIRVRASPGCAELQIEDDGRGLGERDGTRAARGGWGLPAMRERAEALGGQLSVQSTERGTCISVTIPLFDAD